MTRYRRARLGSGGYYFVPVAIFVVCLVVMIGCIVLAIKASNDFEDHCKALGGHTKDSVSVGTGLSPSGKPVVVTTTITFCLSSDGRILDTE